MHSLTLKFRHILCSSSKSVSRDVRRWGFSCLSPGECQDISWPSKLARRWRPQTGSTDCEFQLRSELLRLSPARWSPTTSLNLDYQFCNDLPVLFLLHNVHNWNSIINVAMNQHCINRLPPTAGNHLKTDTGYAVTPLPSQVTPYWGLVSHLQLDEIGNGLRI
jgi:hypothetical protein